MVSPLGTHPINSFILYASFLTHLMVGDQKNTVLGPAGCSQTGRSLAGTNRSTDPMIARYKALLILPLQHCTILYDTVCTPPLTNIVSSSSTSRVERPTALLIDQSIRSTFHNPKKDSIDHFTSSRFQISNSTVNINIIRRE